MRIFALSDLHIDHPDNRRWLGGLSSTDHVDDALILAGDVSDNLASLAWCFATLAERFRRVMFVPGNHDLWAYRDPGETDSFDRLATVDRLASGHGVQTTPWITSDLAIVPLHAWYDDSFGSPGTLLKERWSDYRACRWPPGMDTAAICRRMLAMNDVRRPAARQVVTFSHFVPRPDLLLRSERWAFLDPVMGSIELDLQIRAIGSSMHVFGHSHRQVTLERDGVLYLNRALGYPTERGSDTPALQRIDHLLDASRHHDAGNEDAAT